MNSRPDVDLLRRALRLLVIVDPLQSRGRTVEEVARLAVRGGATSVQLRDKEGADAQVLEAAMVLGELLRPRSALFFVNDRVDIARLSGADGCHLGPEDLSLLDARRVWPDGVLGFSAGTPDEARRAERDGADYLGVGPVFETPSKQDAGPAIGPDGLASVIAATSLPVVAIGGISVATVASCLAAGAGGVAVLAAVTSAASVAPAARAIRRRVERSPGTVS